jgi:hypothetical protein
VILRLSHAEPVAEGILENCFHSVELVFGLGQEFHALSFEFLVRLAAVGGRKRARAQRASFDQMGHRGHVFFLQFRSWRDLHQNDFKIGLAFGVHGKPAKSVGHGLVGVDFKSQFGDVEVFSHVLVENKNGCYGTYVESCFPPGDYVAKVNARDGTVASSFLRFSGISPGRQSGKESIPE